MIRKRVVLHFPKNVVRDPTISILVKDYHLMVNIMMARFTPSEEGVMAVELGGRRQDYDHAMKYLAEHGVSMESLSRDIIRNESKCMHCTACVALCPSKALYVKDRVTMQVCFDSKKCVACEVCIGVCPYGAMEINFED